MEKIKTVKIVGDAVLLAKSEIEAEIEYLESLCKKYDKKEYEPLRYMMSGRIDALSEIIKIGLSNQPK